MIKAVIQFLILITIFFATWFLLSQINFTERAGIEKLSAQSEEKIGKLLMEVILDKNDEVKNDSINHKVINLTKRICTSNNIDTIPVKIFVINSEEVNALTLPGNRLVIFTGLVSFCKNDEELAGVIAHELAHMEKGHVIKKLIKEVGLSMLFVIAGGNGGAEILAEVLRTLSSKAFDREQETEADMHAIQLLSNAGLPPTGLSDFLFRLSQTGSEMPDELVLLSTHPGSAERSAAIIREASKYRNVRESN